MKMKNKEDLLGYDFQGWPYYKQTIRDFLIGFGLTLEEGIWIISDDDPKLDIRPSILHDDGMGYGVNEEFPISIDVNNGNCHIFADVEDKNLKNEEN